MLKRSQEMLQTSLKQMLEFVLPWESFSVLRQTSFSYHRSSTTGEKERVNESSLKSSQWYTTTMNLLEEDAISKYELCLKNNVI
jgi:hypothetical protein